MIVLRLGPGGDEGEQGTQAERLAALGAKISLSHKSQHVNGADAVVVSSAVKADNPEVVAAREQRVRAGRLQLTGEPKHADHDDVQHPVQCADPLRAPFLDADLAEFALRLPARLKAGRTGPGKRILRALAEKTYGVNVSRAAKQGFSIPVHEWLRGPARPLAEDLLSTASLSAIPELDAAAITRVVNEHVSGRRAYGWELWGLMVLVAWHRQQIQRRPGRRHRSRPVMIETA